MPIEDHELKTWPTYFQEVVSGEKPFEFRKDDRNFYEGCTLWLREYLVSGHVAPRGGYSGRNARVIVQKIWRELPGLPKGYCIMKTKLLDYWKTI